MRRAAVPRCRHDGRADCRASRQRGRAGAPAGSHCRRRPPGTGAGAQAQAGSVLRAGQRRPHHHRRLRHRPRRRLPACDWIIEAIVERLDAEAGAARAARGASQAPTAIVSSNTSGIPIAALAEGRSAEFRRHWLGTHFFNPPRYLKLLEIIPTADTDPAVVDRLDEVRRPPSRQGRRRRQGHAELHRQSRRHVRHAARAGDARWRRALDRGDRRHHRPGAGAAEERHLPDRRHCRHRRDVSRRPQHRGTPAGRRRRRALHHAADRRRARQARLGRGEVGPGVLQAGQGRRRQERDPRARSEDVRVPAAGRSRSCRRSRRRARSRARRNASRRCFSARTRSARSCARRSARRSIYTAAVAPDIASSIDDVDRAMRWGFGWDMGPFELWDAIGIKEVLTATGTTAPPPLVKERLDARPQHVPRRRAARPAPGAGGAQERRGGPAASSRRTPAPACSTSATACWGSSSIRR